MTTAHLDLAQAFLEGRDLDWPALEQLVKQLKGDGQFAQARAVLAKAAKLAWPPDMRADHGNQLIPDWIEQQRALCTYKDTELPPLSRFREALGILNGIGLYDDGNNNAETLGLGGAIYKRMWEHDGNVASLHAALSLYRAGWRRDRECDRGYCGVNATFLLDKLAQLAERAAAGVGGERQDAQRLRDEANALRREILDFLDRRAGEDAGNVWALMTRAELHFGLGAYEAAQALLARARELQPEDWKVETHARQLVALAHCQGLRPAPGTPGSREQLAWAALAALLDTDAEAACGLVRGRVGLALSGGGFRASFYHLGVLARLAEVDALRHVEVISTVSGGSIVGVLYYLELKQLLETKSDLSIAPDDYVQLVERVQTKFFAAVERNLRMRTLASLVGNLKMLLPGFSRSNRIGELYEDEIYARVGDGTRKRLTMTDLLIVPAGHDQARQFKPNQENWRRRAKVPVLLINATSLNSGHNFQFTANWMGEPPGLVGAEVDMNARYRRVYYRDILEPSLKCHALGNAVAASAGVPMLFEPLPIDGLYPGRKLRLVDGGVHDNQGASGLLDESCDFILCSDASGQMHDEAKPGDSLVGTALRSSEIAQDRVREAQYEDLAARERGGALRGLLFMHLKDGLEAEPIAPIGQDAAARPAPRPNQTPYGIDRDIQRRLAELRTDLDSFTEVEAQSLMLSGYRATDWQLRHEHERHQRKGGQGDWGDFKLNAPLGNWVFRQLEAIAAKPAASTDLRRQDLEKQLAAGKQLFFKAVRLVPAVKALAGIAILGVLAGLAWLAWCNWNSSMLDITWGQAIALVAVTALVAAYPVLKFLDPRSAGRNLLIKLALPVFGWFVANFQLWFIDPLFRKRGRIARLLSLPADDS